MIKATMKRLIFCSVLILLAASQTAAYAEKADSAKPSVVDANQMTYDDVQQVNTFIGNVVLTRGTLVMHAERVVVTTDPYGYQYATLYAGNGKLATFRQKRDGGADLWIEGEADRIEYDGKTEIAKLFSRAKMQRLDGVKITDSVKGEFISYDSRAEYYTVNNTANGDSKAGAGRITAVIQPRIAPGASTPGGAPAARTTTTVTTTPAPVPVPVTVPPASTPGTSP